MVPAYHYTHPQQCGPEHACICPSIHDSIPFTTRTGTAPKVKKKKSKSLFTTTYNIIQQAVPLLYDYSYMMTTLDRFRHTRTNRKTQARTPPTPTPPTISGTVAPKRPIHAPSPTRTPAPALALERRRTPGKGARPSPPHRGRTSPVPYACCYCCVFAFLPLS